MRRAAIERLLPAVFQRDAGPGGVLNALLAAMESLHAPSERTLAAVDDLFTPYRAPDRLVGFLAGWLALDHVVPPGHTASPSAASPSAAPSSAVPVGRLRDLVARGAELAQWRGTAAGLSALLQTATGCPGFVIDEPPERPFHIVVRVPAAAADHLPLIRRVVAKEKPAACTCDVTVHNT